MTDFSKIRTDFPILSRKIKGKSIVYLDNAATTQKPKQVIESLVNFYNNYNANIHRGVHRLSQEASEFYEEAHVKVARFINAHGKEEIIFTKNTTESINIVANGLNLQKGDEVILTEMEHHSNIVPWLMLKEKGVIIKYIPVKEDGTLDVSRLENLITPRTKIIGCVHISNFLGTVNPVEEIVKIAHKHNVKVLIDGAQSVPRMPVDVRKVGCDFLAFSSHKMCGPTGIGVLYGKKEELEKLKPLMGGGDMILDVTYESFKSNVLPWKFEAGTPNIADGYAFGIAIDYLQKIGTQNILAHEKELTKYALEQMKKISGIKIYGSMDTEKRLGTISFNVRNMQAHDVAAILNERENIMLRSGHHCVMPLHKKFGVDGSVRVSFYFYNTKEEIDIFIKALAEVSKVFG
jgi:cysteine desulfurase/selenocysteine lyase